MHQDRPTIRRLRLLLVAAFVAIGVAVPGASEANAWTWGSAVKPPATADVSSDAASQGLPKSLVALGGFTSQRWPVVLEVAGRGKRIPIAATGLDLTCSSGEQFPTEDAFAHLGVAKSGRVHEADLIPPQGSDFLGGSHSLTGHLDKRRATFQGVWQLQLMFKATDGSIDTCRTGPVALFATL